MEELFSLFTLQVAKCSRCIRKIKQEEMETFNLKGPHVSCLHYLYKSNGSLTLKELTSCPVRFKRAKTLAFNSSISKGLVI